MPMAAINGGEIHYEVTGDGPYLLLIAGLGQSSWSWDPVLPNLVRRYHCIILDNRGTGRSSPMADGDDLTRLADDVAGLVRYLGLETVDIVGWSLGGAVLQTMLVGEQREVINRAILLNTLPAYSEIQHLWLDSFLALRGKEADTATSALLQLSWSFTPRLLSNHSRAAKAVRTMVDQPYPTEDSSFILQAEALRKFDLTAELSTVTTPTLVLAGAEDVLTPVEQSIQLATLIPSATLRVLPRGSHGMILEYPEDTLDALMTYLDEPTTVSRRL